MIRISRVWPLALALAVAFQASPARAVDSKIVPKKGNPQDFLPNDSEYVVTISVRKILDAPLVKKNLDVVKQILKGEEAQKYLKPLAFDPLKDVDTITSAGPVTMDKDKGLGILTGKFDVAKFHKRAEEFAKDKGEILKITKSGNYKVWEITPPNKNTNVQLPKTIYAVLLDKNTLVFSAGKDYINEAIAKAAGTKKTALKKELAALLKKVDKKLALSAVVLAAPIGNALENAPIPGDIDKVKEGLEKLTAISAGVQLGDDIKIQVGIGAKDKDTAKEISKKINQALLAAPLLIQLAAGDERVAPFVDVAKDLLNAVKAKRDSNTVNITLTITKELMGKLEKAGKQAHEGKQEK
jgi:hypothetical protein